MVKETVPTAKGWVKIWGINKAGEKKLLVNQKNALVLNAKKIIAYALGNQSGYFIDAIEVYKAGGLLATSPPVTYSFPTNEKVKFITRFNETSFNDTFDEIRLISTGGGDFSIVTGLSVLKDNTLQLQIEWLLTINDI